MEEQRDSTAQLSSGLNVIVGLWLVISPFALDYVGVGDAARNAAIVGLLVAVMAAVRAMSVFRQVWLSWANVVLGVWLIVSPWILGHDQVTAATWNHVITGLVIAVLAGISAMASTSVDRDHVR